MTVGELTDALKRFPDNYKVMAGTTHKESAYRDKFDRIIEVIEASNILEVDRKDIGGPIVLLFLEENEDK